MPIEDLASHRERKPDHVFDNPCEACGLSLYRDVQDLHELRKFSGGFRKMLIAVAVLDGAPGALARTRSKSHHTWWLPEEADRNVITGRFVQAMP